MQPINDLFLGIKIERKQQIYFSGVISNPNYLSTQNSPATQLSLRVLDLVLNRTTEPLG